MRWPLVISEGDLTQEKIIERLRAFLSDAVLLVGADLGCFKTVLPWMVGFEELYLFSDERSPLIPFARKGIPVSVLAGNIYIWNIDENDAYESFVAKQLRGSGIGSLVYIPLFFGDRVWAKIVLYSKRKIEIDSKSILALNYISFGMLMLLVNYDAGVRAKLHTAKWQEVTHRFSNTAGLIDLVLAKAVKGDTVDDVKAKVREAQGRLAGARIVSRLVLQERNSIVLYLNHLLSTVFEGAVRVFGREEEVSFDFSGDSFITLSLTQSQAIAGVAFELFSNSFKYAIREGERGVLSFQAIRSGNEVILLYFDSGPGVYRSDKAQGVGLEIIKSLMEGIGGSFVLLSRDSFMSEIRFKL